MASDKAAIPTALVYAAVESGEDGAGTNVITGVGGMHSVLAEMRDVATLADDVCDA